MAYWGENVFRVLSDDFDYLTGRGKLHPTQNATCVLHIPLQRVGRGDFGTVVSRRRDFQ